MTKEKLSYEFTNFVADFGGYLGLLLGASLLSIYDGLIEICRRIESLSRNNNKVY